jgi:acyl-CoA dehydrogenase
MDFEFSPKVQQLQQRVGAFMDEHVHPNEARFHEEIAANRRAGNAWVPTTVV